MSKRIPAYLKIHVEDGATSAKPTSICAWGELSATFFAATGWPLIVSQDQTTHHWRISIPAEEAALAIEPRKAGDRTAAEQLAAAINKLIDRTQETELALWKREAELAAGVPVSQRPDEPAHLAERLEAVLRGGVEAVQADAAALYMLDDSTSELKLRAVWGLPRERFVAAARPLRGSVADLEALVGHAVVLEDTTLLPHWKVPENFPAAMCVPVSTSTTPLGTLWVFSNTVRDFSTEQTNLIEIIAGRIAAELEREMLLEQSVDARETQVQLARAARRRQERLPTFAPLVDGWELKAWTSLADRLAADFFDWGVLCDGRLYIATGSAEGVQMEGAMISTAVHAALKSHALYPHGPQNMLERINETLWTGSSGDQFASLFYGLIDPDEGHFEFAFAGRIYGMIVSERGTRPLNCQAAFLGVGPESPFSMHRARVRRGESIVVVTDGLMRTRSASRELLSLDAIADCARRSMRTAEGMVDQIRSLALAHAMDGTLGDATVLVARRLE